jgi:hypothetical protein
MAGGGPSGEAGAGHAFAEATFGKEIVLETTQLLVE